MPEIRSFRFKYNSKRILKNLLDLLLGPKVLFYAIFVSKGDTLTGKRAQKIIMKKPKYNRIKAVLAERGIPNKDLAEKIGVTEGAVSTWCRNFKQPKIETLFEIAKYLKVEATDLISTMKAADL